MKFARVRTENGIRPVVVSGDEAYDLSELLGDLTPKTLPLLAEENVGSRFVVPTVAGSIDVVVQVALERDGTRRVREIVAVPGRVEDDVIEVADLFTRRGDELVRSDGFPPHLDRFERAGHDVTAILGAPRS